MAYITTDNNYTTVLCSKCGQEVKVDTSKSINTWCHYQCQHCGHIGKVEIEPMNKPIKEDVLQRIADSLDEIKDLLKGVVRK